MIKSNSLTTLFCAVFLSTITFADDVLPELPGKENFHVFLLAGQSNMAGRGEVTDEDLKIHPRDPTYPS
jgi:hypothetical protein